MSDHPFTRVDTMNKWYGLALATRVGLMLYGVWQDANMPVKYTDVDYFVFTDAAQFVAQGNSPYLRATYRYSPILAWALTPNMLLSPLFGKLIFIAFDVLVGRVIYEILKRLGCQHETCRNSALVWLLNPLPATVSSRGNAESVMAFLVLKSLSSLMERRVVLAAVFYALSIHFKIYPIIFSLPVYLYLGARSSVEVTGKGRWQTQGYTLRIKSFFMFLLPNRERCLFISVSVLVLGILTAAFYVMYGWMFIYETYLYHIVRGDIKHNFSPYFYLLYLTSDPVRGVPLCLRLLVFLPQACLVVAVAMRYYRDQPLCWFLCTFTFVMANKVCTSQYFLWYLSLLPLVLPHVKIGLSKALALVSLWFGAQVLWLVPAYYLEFEGLNSFIYVWAAGLVFFCANAVIVYAVSASYSPAKMKT